jgi:hypothetical protein
MPSAGAKGRTARDGRHVCSGLKVEELATGGFVVFCEAPDEA